MANWHFQLSVARSKKSERKLKSQLGQVTFYFTVRICELMTKAKGRWGCGVSLEPPSQALHSNFSWGGWGTEEAAGFGHWQHWGGNDEAGKIRRNLNFIDLNVINDPGSLFWLIRILLAWAPRQLKSSNINDITQFQNIDWTVHLLLNLNSNERALACPADLYEMP